MTKCITIISTIIVTFCVSDCCFSEQLLQHTNELDRDNNITLRRSNALMLTEEEENEIDNMLKEIETSKNEEERLTKMIKAAIGLNVLLGINIDLAKKRINNLLESYDTKDLIQRLNDYTTILKFTVMQLKEIQQRYNKRGIYSKEDINNAKELLDAYRIYLEKINNVFKTNGANLLNNIREEDKRKQNKLSLLCVTFEAFLKSFINSASNKNINDQ